MFRFFIIFTFAFFSVAFSAHAESFDTVQKTRILRCGYSVQPPFITQDSQTNEMGGLFFDIMQEVVSRLELKVEWIRSAGGGPLPQNLTDGKFDAFCGMLWEMPMRASAVTFTRPLYYNAINPCVSEKAHYKRSTTALNAPDKTVIGFEGDVSVQIARNVFPESKLEILPPDVTFEEGMKRVVSGKVDAYAACDNMIIDDINKTIGGGLKIAAPDKPVTYIPVGYALPLGDYKLKGMMDSAIFEMQADGTLARIIARHVGAQRLRDTTIIPPVTAR